MDSTNTAKWSQYSAWNQYVSVFFSWRLFLPLTSPCARFPCCLIITCFVLVFGVIAFSIAVVPMKIETNFDSFVKSDVESSVRMDAFTAALLNRVEGRRLQADSEVPSGGYNIKDVTLFYQLHGGEKFDNEILSPVMLRKIAKFERGLRALPEWQKWCARAADSRKESCQYGYSFVNYGQASQVDEDADEVPEALFLNGESWGPLQLDLAARLAHDRDEVEVFFPKRFDPADLRGTSLRSYFRFYIPHQGSANRYRNDQEWTKDLEASLMPYLRRGFGEEEDADKGVKLNVYFSGSSVDGVEVLEALWFDLALAGLSLAFVIGYLIFHTRSVSQSLVGIFTAVLAVPLTYSLCALIGDSTVSFAYFLAVFLTIGFGCDTILIYTDYWCDSANHCHDYPERLAWTYFHGGSASIATTGTTALAFFANLASVIRALRQFGFFMGMCVTLAWVLISVIYVPFFVVKERCCTGCWWRLLGKSGAAASDVPYRIRLFLGYGEFVNQHRRLLIILPVLCILAGFAGAVGSLNVAITPPSMFPPDHNRNIVEEAAANYEDMANAVPVNHEPRPAVLPVCSHLNFSVGMDYKEMGYLELPDDCKAIWCDAVPAVGQQDCPCYRKWKSQTCRPGQKAQVRLRVAGATLDGDGAQSALASFLDVSLPRGSKRERTSFDLPVTALKFMLMQHWSTGAANLYSYQEVSDWVAHEPGSNHPCGWDDVCFCADSYVCKEPGSDWVKLQQGLQMPAPQPFPRLLQGTSDDKPKLSARVAAKVMVVWGIKVDESPSILWSPADEDMWSFTPEFIMQDPWTQREIYQFCMEIPANLKVQRTYCWMIEFHDCVTLEGQRFPVLAHRFDDEAERCLSRESQKFWTRGGQARAMYATFQLGIRKNSQAGTVLKLNLFQRPLKTKRCLPRVCMMSGDERVSCVEVRGLDGQLIASSFVPKGTAWSQLRIVIEAQMQEHTPERTPKQGNTQLILPDGCVAADNEFIPESSETLTVTLIVGCPEKLRGRSAFPASKDNEDPSTCEYCLYAGKMMRENGGYLGSRVRFVAEAEHCHVKHGMQGIIQLFDGMNSFAVNFHIQQYKQVWVSMTQCELLETADRQKLLPGSEGRHPEDE